MISKLKLLLVAAAFIAGFTVAPRFAHAQPNLKLDEAVAKAFFVVAVYAPVMTTVAAAYASVMTTICAPVAVFKGSDHPEGFKGAFGVCFWFRIYRAVPAAQQNDSSDSRQPPPTQGDQVAEPSTNSDPEHLGAEAAGKRLARFLSQRRKEN
jgi:hypothetical protein